MDPSQSPTHRYFNRKKVHRWINKLENKETRETALLELRKMSTYVEDLAPILWSSSSAKCVLFEEISIIYPLLKPPTLTAPQANRVCTVLELLQCVAANSKTRSAFLKAGIPHQIYPFLKTGRKTGPFECLRLATLGVIGTLFRADDQQVIETFMTTEIVKICIFILNNGSDLSKSIGAFILMKILWDDYGMEYICKSYTRHFHIKLIKALEEGCRVYDQTLNRSQEITNMALERALASLSVSRD